MKNFRFLVCVSAHEFVLGIRRSYDEIITWKMEQAFVPPSLLFLRGGSQANEVTR